MKILDKDGDIVEKGFIVTDTLGRKCEIIGVNDFGRIKVWCDNMRVSHLPSTLGLVLDKG